MGRTRGRRARIIHVALPNNKGPAVFPVELGISQAGLYEIEAWSSIVGESNVHILDGEPSLKEAENEVNGEGNKELVMTLAKGKAWAPLDLTAQKLTVFFEGENKSGQKQVITLEIRECS